jgi:hypothetical protein
MQQTTSHSNHMILELKPQKRNEILALEYKFKTLEFTIYFCEETRIYRAIISNSARFHGLYPFSMQSKYREGIIQDCLDILNSPEFLKMFGLRIYQNFKKMLHSLLESV